MGFALHGVVGIDQVARSRLSPTLNAAYLAVMGCDADAEAALDAAGSPERRKALFWALSLRLAELRGDDTAASHRIYEIMTGNALVVDADPRLRSLDAMAENGARGASADAYGYRRAPFEWSPSDLQLPSPGVSFALWMTEPVESVRSVGLGHMLGPCQLITSGDN